jgi:beta-lactamase regulating signal transducer with metallopeptidase domain
LISLLPSYLLIFQWFNPFAWIYRREIESNLEFLTDDQLMQQKKVDKQSYQLSLVKVSAPTFSFEFNYKL